jgi:thioesterase domain-containing protein
MKAVDFQKHAEKMFPVVPHMGLSVVKLDENECLLSGDLKANSNHLGTAFGGSLYCFAALACYGVVWSALSKSNMMTQDIVIAEGKIQYKNPVSDNFEVKSVASSEMKNFISILKNKKKARLGLTAEVRCKGDLCATFEGFYVAFLKEKT